MALQGCGGGSSDTGHADFVVRTETTIETGALPRPAYLVRIQQYCQRAWSTLPPEFTKSLAGEDGKQATRERYREAMRDVVLRGLGFHIFDAFRILGAPAGEEKTVEAIAGALQEAIERGQRLNPIDSMIELSARFRTFSHLAARYGLKDCTVTAAHLKL